MEQKDAKLTFEEAGDPGCGMGTEKACFALVLAVDELQCSKISSPGVAQAVGIKLGWRVNTDPADGKAWCPKGVLDNSKKPLG